MRLITAGLFMLLLTSGANAKNVAVPERNPVITMVFPDSWKATEIERGYDAVSPDDGVYFSVESAPMSQKDQLVDENNKWMASNSITPISRTTSALNIDGISCGFVKIAAKDGNGPTKIDFVVCPVSGDRLLMMTVWGSEKDRESNRTALDGIESSIKAIR
ncbi:MAG: hypothetical protein KGQ42_06445 [Alphaproteobacteria bacterium]|nr:hypothetical protein [Alphaproteobacteria bacterium]MDE2041740.1 hypothetical protein [Alphaproteobacteria bacterium]MDE2340893.1 hypothetical protein [Alphaproteobacteria bacterium]